MVLTTTHGLRRSVALFALLGALAGCPPTPPNNDGGVDAGGCSTGEVGCACSGGSTCTTGECVSGSCVACTRGSAACACRMNATCDTGLRCATSGVCETCPAGQSGCACGAGDTCGAGLKCDQGTCVADTCTAGASACPCRSTSPKCDGTNYCDTTNRCQGCTPDVVGCGCGATSTCSGGLVCNTTTMLCRNAVRCADLLDGGTCAPHQSCTEATGGGDAICNAGACDTGYKWDARTMTCLACSSPDCANEPTCANGDGGIGDMCAAAHRDCMSSGNPLVSYCGDCLPGFSLSNGACVAAQRCGSTTCAPNEYCDDFTTPTAPPTCLTLPCPAGQAKTATSACSSCNGLTCMSQGMSGRVWPFRLITGECICETEQGYFRESGASGDVKACDKDGDGWVNQKADDSTINNDTALKTNARCSIRGANTVRLVDEFGTPADVKVCAGSTPLILQLGPTRSADGGVIPAVDAGSCTPSVIRLLETEITDTPGQPVGTKFPTYGGDAGRTLEAFELNALTKACVTDNADFNNDGNSDVLERQTQPRTTLPADTQLLLSFAYFMELNTSYFQPGPGDAGVLVIRERSRCAPTFPMHYSPTGVLLADGGVSDRYVSDIDAGSVYWRNCDRRRPSTFDLTKPGYDFQNYDCPAASGSCAWQEIASRTLVGPTDPRTTRVGPFGICDLAGQPPADGRWRGMLHASQFKCVNVTTNPSSEIDVLDTDTGAGRKFTINQCRARKCTSPTDPGCRVTPGTGAQTAEPRIECTAVTPTTPPPGINWVAVNYQPYANKRDYQAMSNPGGYLQGCINEDVESDYPPIVQNPADNSYICPFPEFSMIGRNTQVNMFPTNAFGRYSCFGKKPNSLWAPSDGGVQRATLRWSTNAAQMNNGFLR